MRASSAVFLDTSMRLWDLEYPRSEVLLGRTRAAYVHLDNLIAFSKRDRDGKVDAYLAAYLPDEIVLLFLITGEVVNSAIVTPSGRYPAAISEATQHIRSEPERGEIAFHTASAALLASMYATCAQPPLDVKLDTTSPESVFKTLYQRKWSGLLELVSDGRVNYLEVKDGRFSCGYFSDQRQDEAPNAYVSRMFAPTGAGVRPRVAVRLFPGLGQLPHQAPPAMVKMFRKYFWDLNDLAEKEMPGEGQKRAERTRTRLSAQHEVLRSVGGARGSEPADPIAEPSVFADGMAAWTKEFLGELEVLHPSIAPRLLTEAAREHRFALGSLGFFERLPWRAQW